MFRSTSNFDKLLDKATSNLRLEPDWPTILQITDLIRQGDVQSKYALTAMKKKMYSANPHVAMFALLVLESCVKNCGSLIHEEVGTKVYMEQLKELVKTSPHDNIKAKVLELIQTWAFAFRNSPKYRAVQDTVTIMKTEGYKFPALKESDAMFSADTAPEWVDGECCHRCRVQFSMMQRKHHCRACGQVFCAQCSGRTCTLPKFGIEKDVRVCEACFEKLSKPSAAHPAAKSDELPAEYLTSSLAQQNQAPPPRKTEEELREEEELQLALALSQSEAEQKDKHKLSRTSSAPNPVRMKAYSPPPASGSSGSPPADEVDPELARYLNRGYWEQRQQHHHQELQNSPSAPATHVQHIGLEQNGTEDSGPEMEAFVRALRSQVEIFVNRMKSNSSRGRDIANDSSVQTLFLNITEMRSRLLHYIQQQDDSRVHFERLQDKLTQVKDARAALDALREEHRDKVRREAELAERQRQRQMAHKLDIMRKKKQEYLQYQRQLALQRIQEQEREMQMRQEQQKQQYLMGQQQYGGYMQQQQPTQQYAPTSQQYPPLQPPYMHQSGMAPPPTMMGPPQHPGGYMGPPPPQGIHGPIPMGGMPPPGPQGPPLPMMGMPQQVMMQQAPLHQGPPQQGLLQQGVPQGLPQQGLLQQGVPQQGMLQQGVPQGILQQGPSQGLLQQGMPPQQGPPQQGMLQQGVPQQGLLQQGVPQQGVPQQGPTPQGLLQQGVPPQQVGPADLQGGLPTPQPPHMMPPPAPAPYQQPGPLPPVSSQDQTGELISFD